MLRAGGGAQQGAHLRQQRRAVLEHALRERRLPRLRHQHATVFLPERRERAARGSAGPRWVRPEMRERLALRRPLLLAERPLLRVPRLACGGAAVAQLLPHARAVQRRQRREAARDLVEEAADGFLALAAQRARLAPQRRPHRRRAEGERVAPDG